MKRKLITYFFLSMFLLSTVGIPLTLHYCKGMNSVSFKSCGMSEKESSDCAKTNNETTINSNNLCCSKIIVAEASQEKYIASSFEISKIDLKVLVSHRDYSLPELLTKKNTFPEPSPPASYSNNLYINNSILLI